MGTNYYMTTKNKNVAHKFATKIQYGDTVEWLDAEYKLLDEPDFHYEIHLNKLSYGWKPLFQIHKPFKTFAELEQFYFNHKDDIEFEDEYGDKYSFEEYKQEVIDHSNLTPEPIKWVYKENDVCGKPGRKYLMTERCSPEEADLWTPFDHIEYGRTQHEARDILCAWDAYISWNNDYMRDPDYKFDWVEGDFL